MNCTLLTVAALALTGTSASAQQTHRFFTQPTASYGFYGYAVDLDGGFSLGGTRTTGGSTGGGAVWIHSVASGGLVGILEPLDGAPGDDFGFDVRAEGGVALVGALGDDAGGPDAGAAYLFDLATQTQTGKLLALDGAAGDRFGFSVDIRGDRALVGAPVHDAGLVNTGAAYLFAASTGQQLAKYVALDGIPGDEFGIDCAMNDDHVVVGAHKHSTAAVAAGAAYLFDRGTGQQLAKFTAPLPRSFSNYGRTVAISDDYAIVGYPEESVPGGSGGAVYVYELTTSQLVARIGNPLMGSMFGSALDVDGGTLAVGASNNSVSGGATIQGTIHLYDLSTIQATQQPFATYSEVPANAFVALGTAVAIDGERVVGGAPDINGLTYFLGATMLFGPGGTTVGTPSCFGVGCPCGNNQFLDVGCSNGTGRGALLSAAVGGSTAKDDLVLVTETLPPNAFGLTFMGDMQIAPAALGNGLRCVGGNLFRFPVFQASPGGVATLGSSIVGNGVVSTSCSQFLPAGCIQAGSTWHFQTWYRDTTGPCGGASNLSNALSITFEP